MASPHLPFKLAHNLREKEATAYLQSENKRNHFLAFEVKGPGPGDWSTTQFYVMILGPEPTMKGSSPLMHFHMQYSPFLSTIWGRQCDLKEREELSSLVCSRSHSWEVLSAKSLLNRDDGSIMRIVLLPLPSPLNFSYLSYLFSSASFFLVLKPNASD